MGTAASYPRLVTRVSLPPRRSPRVYYRWFWVIVAALLAAAIVGTAAARAQVEITVHPSMVKGAPGAPVTIVEFSDYQ
jgi:hypothetical protein